VKVIETQGEEDAAVKKEVDILRRLNSALQHINLKYAAFASNDQISIEGNTPNAFLYPKGKVSVHVSILISRYTVAEDLLDNHTSIFISPESIEELDYFGRIARNVSVSDLSYSSNFTADANGNQHFLFSSAHLVSVRPKYVKAVTFFNRKLNISCSW